MISSSTLFKVIKDPQPGRPDAIAVIRGDKKIACPTLRDYLEEVVKVFYEEGGQYTDVLQVVAKQSMMRKEDGSESVPHGRMTPSSAHFSTTEGLQGEMAGQPQRIIVRNEGSGEAPPTLLRSGGKESRKSHKHS